MRCPNCENENRPSAKFCDECGFPLTGAILKASQASSDEETVSDKGTSEFEQISAEKYNGESNDIEIDVQEESFESVSEDDADVCDSPTEILDAVDQEEDGVSEDPSESGDSDPFEEITGDYPFDADDWEDAAQSSDMGLNEDADNADATIKLSDFDDFEDSDTTLVFNPYRFDGEFDDAVLADGYEKPISSWRDGNTLIMDPISGDDEQKSKDYLASSTAQKNPRAKKIAIIVCAIVAAVLVAIGVSYALELWGGKSIPDVTGLTEAEATTILQDEGFTVRSMEVKSDDTEGLVLVMDPSSGSRADEGSEIVIHIATARLIPEIIGMAKDAAAAALQEDGFENIVYVEERSSKPAGEVIGVTPEVGARAKSNDEVQVTLAKPYVVPDISNKYLSDAEAAISDEGLVPAVEYVYTEDYADGIIIGTNPAAGTEVQEGSTVTIQIARSREAECIALTQAYLAPGNTINSGLYGYEIESIESLTYMGNSIVAYSITARPFITGFGETAYFSTQPISGQIEWTASNEIASMT